MSRTLQQIFIAVAIWACCTVHASAQQAQSFAVESPILTIDSDRLFEESDFGRNIISQFESRGAVLAAENRKIEEELIAEEKRLTDLRATMEPAEFRELADAFDAKVQETRRVQDSKSRELNAGLDESRVVFLNAAVPILEQLMREAGATVVLERRSIFISSTAVDITRIAVERLNLTLNEQDIKPEQ